MKTRIPSGLLAQSKLFSYRHGVRLVVRVAFMGLGVLLALLVLASSSAQEAKAEGGCLFPKGSDQLLPYDDCQWVGEKAVYQFHTQEPFFPVYNTTVAWTFDELSDKSSWFKIRRTSDNVYILVYNVFLPRARTGTFTAERGTSYVLEAKLVGADILKKGSVAFWEGIRLDPDDDRCYEAQPYYNVGGGATGHVDFSNDHDWHLINVSTSGVLDVFLKVPFGKNYQLELWKDCSTRLQTSDNPTSQDEEIKQVIDPGTYRIHIYGADPTKDYSRDLSYTVTTSLTTSMPVDLTAPTCNVAYHPAEQDPNGYPSAWFTLQDTQSGIASEKIRYFVDNISFGGVDIPHGTTQPVTIKFYKNDLNRDSRVGLWVWDLAGNGPTKCWLRNGHEGIW